MSPLFLGFLVLFVFSALVNFTLERLNITHLKRFGHVVPDVLGDEIEEPTLISMRDYTVANSRMDVVQSLVHDGYTLFILFSGIITWVAAHILPLNLGLVVSGICFFLVFTALSGALGLPFDLYSQFGIERRFGFSTITFKTWIGDLIKSIIVSVILLGIIWAALLWLIDFSPQKWWALMWVFFALFELTIMVLYPVLIAPLFNKFVPLDDPELVDGIQNLLHKAGLHTNGIYRVDAMKRSRHSNAYFTGVGKTKRIVLYDTLLDSHSHDEILAVLAHEIGHWKKGHVRKQLGMILAISLVALYVCWWLLNWPGLYLAFGIHVHTPFVGLFLLSILAQPLSLFVSPCMAMLSRHFERQADDYAHELIGSTQALALALARLAKDNLANLHPHPWYAWFHYSHPPLVERIERLRNAPDIIVK